MSPSLCEVEASEFALGQMSRNGHLTKAALNGVEVSPETQAGDVQPASKQVAFSFVIPLKDEQATLVELYERISKELGTDEPFEVIFVDDGSRDGSWRVIQSLVERDPTRVRGLRFRRNAGKAAGLTAGFRAARGKIVFTLDADLQDD